MFSRFVFHYDTELYVTLRNVRTVYEYGTVPALGVRGLVCGRKMLE